MKFVNFIKTRKAYYWLILAATLSALIALVAYLIGGKTQFTPDYSVRAIIGGVLGVAFGVLSLIITWRAAVFISYLFSLFACICYITSQINLIGNLIYGVDGSTVPPAMAIFIVFSLVAFITALLAGIMMKPKKENSLQPDGVNRAEEEI